MIPPSDRRGRPLRSLRISVTDRCNLRCRYCMPEEEYAWLPRDEILSFEEIDRLVDAFAALGVDRIRLTGGEPLLRRDLCELVERLNRHEGIREVAMTTNGLRLPETVDRLRRAGLARLTISLDSVQPERFALLTGRDVLPKALRGIEAAAAAGFDSVKINTVVVRGRNDEEIPALLEFARSQGAEIRFIEYMDVGGATEWSRDLVVSRDEILSRVAARFGSVEAVAEVGSAPARLWRLADGTRFGIIASTTRPFCGSCDRSRLTADGRWFLCLYARDGIDLRDQLRSGASREQLIERVGAAWRSRADRGAEARLEVADRGILAAPDELRENRHLEMHTRGG